ncbi:hypothetical protein BU25DRAFT_402482 [Macroventuria anomochaeta]|uniref:Uncharacterized protein n=1 Tax=Macroventuria anomochaeta TaxID=301207 RepID=A0ACB6RM61_9PLEO|nr:uncharacterized protein BU25DRAFT_402482 [Macroventuria anomochaeta]KAF2622480.1 hypothetical protein BU25DRAFT_402482 [Macroventuria anomochaeta]
MAPVDTDAASRSNNLPILIFGGQTLLVAGLTAHVLLTTRRAARALPPSTRTRSQNEMRRRHARIFSAIALLSLASVTTFSVVWRFISYVQWAELAKHETPGSLWQGWYGTGDGGVGSWHLAAWIKDIDLVRESDAVAILAPEGFFYTAQHFVALLASAIFIGVQGHRRDLSPWTIASFVTLGAFGSLGYALSLFFVAILYTPVTVHNDDTPLHDALFTPRPAVYWAPIVSSLLVLNELPKILLHGDTFRLLRLGYLLTPLFLAFAPQITPVALGISHPTKAHAHRSYATVFHFLSIVAFVFYARVFYLNMRHSVPPPPPHHIWDVFSNAVGREASRTNRLLHGLGAFTRKLSKISQHPAVSVTSLDVLLTGVSLLTWTFTRDLDVEALLDSSILSFLVPNHRQHVRFFEPIIKRLDAATNLSDPAELIPTTTPKKRGRKSNAEKAAEASATGASASPESGRAGTRRSTRRSALAAFDDAVETPEEDDADDTYVPDEKTHHEIQETEADGASTDDYVEAAESTALAIFLTFLGGLGQLASAALGAEVAGPQE